MTTGKMITTVRRRRYSKTNAAEQPVCNVPSLYLYSDATAEDEHNRLLSRNKPNRLTPASPAPNQVDEPKTKGESGRASNQVGGTGRIHTPHRFHPTPAILSPMPLSAPSATTCPSSYRPNKREYGARIQTFQQHQSEREGEMAEFSQPLLEIRPTDEEPDRSARMTVHTPPWPFELTRVSSIYLPPPPPLPLLLNCGKKRLCKMGDHFSAFLPPIDTHSLYRRDCRRNDVAVANGQELDQRKTGHKERKQNEQQASHQLLPRFRSASRQSVKSGCIDNLGDPFFPFPPPDLDTGRPPLQERAVHQQSHQNSEQLPTMPTKDHGRKRHRAHANAGIYRRRQAHATKNEHAGLTSIEMNLNEDKEGDRRRMRLVEQGDTDGNALSKQDNGAHSLLHGPKIQSHLERRNPERRASINRRASGTAAPTDPAVSRIASHNPRNKTSRVRISIACEACRAFKRKCSGQMPCALCSKRGRGEDCKYDPGPVSMALPSANVVLSRATMTAPLHQFSLTGSEQGRTTQMIPVGGREQSKAPVNGIDFLASHKRGATTSITSLASTSVRQKYGVADDSSSDSDCSGFEFEDECDPSGPTRHFTMQMQGSCQNPDEKPPPSYLTAAFGRGVPPPPLPPLGYSSHRLATSMSTVMQSQTAMDRGYEWSAHRRSPTSPTTSAPSPVHLHVDLISDSHHVPAGQRGLESKTDVRISCSYGLRQTQSPSEYDIPQHKPAEISALNPHGNLERLMASNSMEGCHGISNPSGHTNAGSIGNARYMSMDNEVQDLENGCGEVLEQKELLPDETHALCLEHKSMHAAGHVAQRMPAKALTVDEKVTPNLESVCLPNDGDHCGPIASRFSHAQPATMGDHETERPDRFSALDQLANVVEKVERSVVSRHAMSTRAKTGRT